jgi:RNA polymerase sigma-70 factor, ECF subfamily
MGIDMDDSQAISRLKQGDIGGLETLIARYQVKAVRVAYLITRDERLAEDVTQDAFIRMFHGARYFDASRPFEPYFLRGVVNAALNAVQRERRTEPLADELEIAGLEALLGQAVSVEAAVEAAQLRDRIAEALGRLSPRQRAVVVQRYYLGMSEKDMAETLEVTPGTVKWLLNAARTRLRGMLKSERSTR